MQTWIFEVIKLTLLAVLLLCIGFVLSRWSIDWLKDWTTIFANLAIVTTGIASVLAINTWKKQLNAQTEKELLRSARKDIYILITNAFDHMHAYYYGCAKAFDMFNSTNQRGSFSDFYSRVYRDEFESELLELTHKLHRSIQHFQTSVLHLDAEVDGGYLDLIKCDDIISFINRYSINPGSENFLPKSAADQMIDELQEKYLNHFSSISKSDSN